MNRSFHTVDAREHVVYSAHEVEQLYGIHKNTLSKWIKDGLRPSPCGMPHVFRGSELLRFNKARHAASKIRMKRGEVFCLSCKSPVRAMAENG